MKYFKYYSILFLMNLVCFSIVFCSGFANERLILLDETFGGPTTYLDLASLRPDSANTVEFNLLIDYNRPAPPYIAPKPKFPGILKQVPVVDRAVPIRKIQLNLLAHCPQKQYAITRTVHYDGYQKEIYRLQTSTPHWKPFRLNDDPVDRLLYQRVCPS